MAYGSIFGLSVSVVLTCVAIKGMNDTMNIDKAALVYGQMNEPPGNRLRVALTGLMMKAALDAKRSLSFDESAKNKISTKNEGVAVSNQ